MNPFTFMGIFFDKGPFNGSAACYWLCFAVTLLVGFALTKWAVACDDRSSQESTANVGVVFSIGGALIWPISWCVLALVAVAAVICFVVVGLGALLRWKPEPKSEKARVTQGSIR